MSRIAYVSTETSRSVAVQASVMYLEHQYEEVESIPELYKKVCDPDFYPDFLLVDLQSFLDLDDIDIMDHIQGLSLAMRCQSPDWKLRMALVVEETTDPQLIRRLRRLPEVVGAMTTDDRLDIVSEHIQHWLLGHKSITRTVEKILRPTTLAPVKESSEITLTDRQKEILDLVATRGMSNKAIAKMLRITESTVKLHVSAILKKHGLQSRVQLAIFTRRS